MGAYSKSTYCLRSLSRNSQTLEVLNFYMDWPHCLSKPVVVVQFIDIRMILHSPYLNPCNSLGK